MKYLLLSLCCLIFLSGCARVDPFSPRLRQRIDNQGEIEDIRNTQNSILWEVGRIRTEVHGDDNVAQSFAGQRVRANTGVQILSGDGALIVILIIGVGLFLVIFYRNRAVKSEKTAEILSHQIALYNDPTLEENILLEAMNSPVEDEVYHMIVKNQRMMKH